MESSVTSVNIDDNELAQLMMLKEMYEKTTRITNQCFDTCINRPTQGKVSESDRNCLANCAANFLHSELLFTRRLVNAAHEASHANAHKDN